MRAVISIDDASQLSSQEEETARIQAQLVRECGDIFSFKAHPPYALTHMPQCEVAVIDFGGLGLGFGGGPQMMATQCARSLQNIVDNRPGCLFLIWSAHTAGWYRDIIAGELEDDDTAKIPNNVLIYDYKDEEFWNKARAFLGIQKPEDTPELDAAVEVYDEVGDKFMRLRAQMNEGPDEPEEENVVEPDDEDEDDEDYDEELACEAQEPAREKQPFPRLLEPWTAGDFTNKLEPPEDGGLAYGDLIGEITIPVRLRSCPGLQKGFGVFKFADCLASLMANDSVTELATLGGTMGGHYEFHINGIRNLDRYDGGDSDDDADRTGMTMFMDTREIWKAFDALRIDFLKKHPEFLHKTEREEFLNGTAESQCVDPGGGVRAD